MFSRMEAAGAAVRPFPWGVSRLVFKDSGSAPAAVMLLFVPGFLTAGIGIAEYRPASRQTSAVLGAAVMGYAAYESDIFTPRVKEHARQNAAPGLSSPGKSSAEGFCAYYTAPALTLSFCPVLFDIYPKKKKQKNSKDILHLF